MKRSSTKPIDMPLDEMRRLGYRVVDLLLERWSGLDERPAWSGGERPDLESLLREDAPEEGRPADEVLDRAVGDILSRAAAIDHARFFAFVPSSPTWPSVLADCLASGFNVFQGTWIGSAGPSQVELVVLEWFRQWLGLPEGAGGLLTSGGSAANLDALYLARERRGNPPSPAVYLSEQGHSSLERAARIVGIAQTGIRRIPTDDDFRMDLAALRSALAEDRSHGLTPICVCANAGTTNTGAIDALRDLGELCRDEGLWYHVDAAYGGFAVLTPEGREALAGLEMADSVTLDPHKWLFQPFETGCLMVRDCRFLERSFRIIPEYLQDTELGAEQVNFGNRGLQLTRSFRALKVWMSVQMLGLGAFREAIGTALEVTREAERYIVRSDDLQLLSAASLGVVCFHFRPAAVEGDAASLEDVNAAIQKEIVESGFAMMSSTRLHGHYALRLCIMNHRTTLDDVLATLARIESVGKALVAGPCLPGGRKVRYRDRGTSDLDPGDFEG